ncbi:hypothetical protein CVD28_01710 [Bacillus sp. M6-12]|uniref:hypothetical protein n=1 Tax=Bacillus sp. M6-12 TaxID=2054166 RepID=UPI000C78E7A6|nr:hypothetical protein [Bacillus sp. M6-12]PLS19150.1 hypothetical protein CVD28_01710 [Bacillus sp. M6-12]
MKQHIVPKQAKQLTEQQFYDLFEEIVPRKDWANYHHKKVTVGKLIEVLRGYGQLEICTIHTDCNVQLFERKVSPTDGQTPLYETKHKELIDALFICLLWLLQVKEE